MIERLGFYWTSKMYPKQFGLDKDCIDEVVIGDYPEDGGTTGEFTIQWMQVGKDIVPVLKVYDDAWKILQESQIGKILSGLDNKNVEPEKFVKILTINGFVDLSKLED